MTGPRHWARSVHGITVEMVCSDADIAAGAARLMEVWPRVQGRRADVRFDLLRANTAELAGLRLPRGRCDHWPGLEIGADGHILWFRRELCGSAVVADLRAGRVRAYMAQRHAGARAVERLFNPLLLVALVQMLARRGIFSIHACAAAHGGRAIVAAAERCAGKSTLAVSLARAGLAVLSDDRVLVRRSPRGIECLAWPGPLNLTEESVALFPELASLSLSPGSPPGKLSLTPDEVYHTPAVDSANPRILLFPTVSDQPESRFDPLPPGEALARLVPCSLFYAHREVLPAHLAVLRDVVNASRCYHLCLGQDVPDVGRRIGTLLSSC